MGKIKVKIRTKTKDEIVLGEQLNAIWAITPAIYKDSLPKHYRIFKYTITHIPTGLQLCTCVNKQTCLSIWKEIKDIKGINSEKTSELKKIQKDISKAICKYKL